MPRFFSLLIVCLLPFSALGNSIQQLETELKQHQFSQATKTGLAIIRLHPDNIKVRFLTAVAFQRNNQPDIAQRYYLQIIDSNPQLPEPRNNLAIIYMDRGQHDQAIETLVSSLKTHPAYATAWQNLNRLYQGLASEAYQKALGQQKNSRSVMDNIQLSALSSLHDVTTLSVKLAIPALKTEQSTQLAPALSLATKKAVKVSSPPPLVLDNVIKPLKAWATAWSQKDFDHYIDAYSATYKGGKSNHEIWVSHRQSRIMKAGSINVQLSNFNIKSQSRSQAVIEFHQKFKSKTYQDKVAKRIYLSKEGNSWKITREFTISIL